MICREWVWRQADRGKGKLPFKPEYVGSHWGRGIQVAVTALNWAERGLHLGECKWDVDRFDAHLVCEFSEGARRLVEKEFEG